ncbi:diguanylate cyclase [Thiorhodovibrio winogradskyi]|nr:diguanylate cyclase [Thiorhodovibrio winogradskyi]
MDEKRGSASNRGATHLWQSLGAARIGTYRLDLSAGRIFGDAWYFRLLGYPPEADGLALEAFLEQLHQEDRRRYQTALQAIRCRLSDQLELCILICRGSTESVPMLDRGQVLIDQERLWIAGVHIDLTGVVAPLRQLASHDQLTGLLSRHGIWRLVEQAHHHAQVSQRDCAIALLDIDHLKDINDMHGTVVGDQLLSALGARLDAHLRLQNITIGRWGGDEFLAIATDTNEAALVKHIDAARQMITNEPPRIDGQAIQVTLSAGVTTARPLMDSAEQALARADLALYRAKKDGCNRVHGSSLSTDNRTMSLAILVQDAVRMARVTPVFQPVVRLRDRQPVAEEAFSRIMENGSRLLNASAFIEVALQLKLLHRIDQMLFDAALERIAYPPANAVCPGKDAGSLLTFVHISEDLIRHPATLNEMVRTINEHPEFAARSSGMLPMVLVLNEHLVIKHRGMVADSLQPMLDFGCKLSITGYGNHDSALELLHQDLAFSFLSFDPCLVQKALESDGARAALARMQQAAHALGITTIAKQIQNPSTLDLVVDLGLDWGQGYLLGVPTDPRWPHSARSC